MAIAVSRVFFVAIEPLCKKSKKYLEVNSQVGSLGVNGSGFVCWLLRIVFGHCKKQRYMGGQRRRSATQKYFAKASRAPSEKIMSRSTALDSTKAFYKVIIIGESGVVMDCVSLFSHFRVSQRYWNVMCMANGVATLGQRLVQIF
jgi:hypothetical protein